MIIHLHIMVVQCRPEPLFLVLLLGRDFFLSPHPLGLWRYLTATMGMRASFNLKTQVEEKVSS